MKAYIVIAAAIVAIPTPALAAPGAGDEVYGATIEPHAFEFEARYGALEGGADNGEDVLNLEAEMGVSNRLQLALVGEFEKEPGEARRFESVGFEAIYALGCAGGLDFALYGEYELAFDGPDKLETRFLVQHRRGPWDLRLNLIAEKELDSNEPVELAYAASADVRAIGELRLGFQAYGELGTFSRFLPRAEHFLGPVAKIEIEGLGPEIELEAGYLFPLSAAKDGTDGQLRLVGGIEF